ncbi:hypothetical protein Bca52824_016143 [Brassica carinata]|uniref:Uncharacterized protein n=1 Tax=Brassica carinata TaxID=52824 RepID=A0A8X8B551_BRACI|nr:hypothetical protein Bca52824_016143 [Brassica carinata]
MEIEKDERLILKIDMKGIWRDKEGRPRSSTRQLINAEGTVIPEVIAVAEMNTFGLNSRWYDWGTPGRARRGNAGQILEGETRGLECSGSLPAGLALADGDHGWTHRGLARAGPSTEALDRRSWMLGRHCPRGMDTGRMGRAPRMHLTLPHRVRTDGRADQHTRHGRPPRRCLMSSGRPVPPK